MARCMTFHADLSKSFWSEAVNTATYILNRLPTKAVAEKTPYEIFYGKKPSISYFRVFGCTAHVHVPDQKISKMDSKSKKMIFIGYSSTSKAYRLWDSSKNEDCS